MTLELLLEKSTIELPNPLRVNELKDLFGYLVRESNNRLEIRYSVDENRIVSDGVPFDRLRSVGVSGTIHSRFLLSASSSFHCTEFERTPDQFSAIQFQTIPGYELEEHSPEERELWDYVRESVSAYFSLQSQYD